MELRKLLGIPNEKHVVAIGFLVKDEKEYKLFTKWVSKFGYTLSVVFQSTEPYIFLCNEIHNQENRHVYYEASSWILEYDDVDYTDKIRKLLDVKANLRRTIRNGHLRRAY